jgi:hypothetical protein
MSTWGARLYGDPCEECGYRWSMSPDDARTLVAGIVARYERLLVGLDGTQRHPSNEWSAREYVCHVADNLRIWAERLVGAARDGVVQVAAYDESALARVRSYASISMGAALWTLGRAARDWAEAVDVGLAADVVLVHPERGEVTVLDIVRSNAHDADHHAWDIERSVAASGSSTSG